MYIYTVFRCVSPLTLRSGRRIDVVTRRIYKLSFGRIGGESKNHYRLRELGETKTVIIF